MVADTKNTSRLSIIQNDRSLSDRVATVMVLIVTMETNPVSLKQCSFVNNVHLIIQLESNTPPYYGIQNGKNRSLVKAVAMNINVNDTDPLNIKLINVFTCGYVRGTLRRECCIIGHVTIQCAHCMPANKYRQNSTIHS